MTEFNNVDILSSANIFPNEISHNLTVKYGRKPMNSPTKNHTKTYWRHTRTSKDFPLSNSLSRKQQQIDRIRLILTAAVEGLVLHGLPVLVLPGHTNCPRDLRIRCSPPTRARIRRDQNPPEAGAAAIGEEFALDLRGFGVESGGKREGGGGVGDEPRGEACSTSVFFFFLIMRRVQLLQRDREIREVKFSGRLAKNVLKEKLIGEPVRRVLKYFLFSKGQQKCILQMRPIYMNLHYY